MVIYDRRKQMDGYRLQILLRILAVLLLSSAAACEGTAPQATTNTPASGRSVWVMSNGWHSEIILYRTDIPPDRIPERAEYPEAQYFAFGWGDARYYPARTPTATMAIRAIAVPTPAVMHMTAITTHPRRYYVEAEVLRLPIDEKGLVALAAYIHDSFERGGGVAAVKTGPGLYRRSGFYHATGSFHLFNTCNTWTSAGLMAAGLPVGQGRAIEAEALMRELRPIAQGEPPQDSPELRPYYFR
jgi:uncharacterized protein (TIGR02117 family)